MARASSFSSQFYEHEVQVRKKLSLQLEAFWQKCLFEKKKYSESKTLFAPLN